MGILSKKKTKPENRSLFEIAKGVFTEKYETTTVEKKSVLIQSYNGASISGNPYYILKELCTNEEYSDYKKYVITNWKNYNANKKFLDSKGFKNVKLIKIHSQEYCTALATAEYLVNNATFPPYFIKKEGQIYLNTWHGTPLKTLGRGIKNAENELGNCQRNFMMADWLLYPNDFTFNAMKRDFMLDNLFKGNYVVSGYPRNSAFFNSDSRQALIDKYGLKGKKIVFYMPTWRGAIEELSTDEQVVYAKHALYEMEHRLDDDTVVFAKMHNYVTDGIDFKSFTKIRQIPDECETYEFLNIADCLVTDYSSVFFDFANTGKKIILYAYDLERYISDRGMYLDFSSLPFTFVYNEDDLIDEINKVQQYSDYSSAMKQYIQYDSAESAAELCNLVFNGRQSENMKVIPGSDFCNNRENVLIFAGTFAKNGITTALKSFVANLDKEKYNYFLTFYKNNVEANKDAISDFGDIDLIPIQGDMNITDDEIKFKELYYGKNKRHGKVKNIVDNIYRREFRRIYCDTKFKYVVHFTGYEQDIFHMFSVADSKSVVYIHSNMKKENELKGNISLQNYKENLAAFDKIVCVRDSAKAELLEINSCLNPDKIYVAHNFIDKSGILEKSRKEICFDKNTVANISLYNLNKIFDSSAQVIINIARFSKEKGLDRLINAFDRYRNEVNENAYLVIVGGYGPEFESITELAEKKHNIILIKNMSNPYPVLKKSDLFVLSSHYEALPMTIMEALVLDVPVICTDITGPAEFLRQGWGNIIENSENGIYNGIVAFHKGELPPCKKFDADDFNRNALSEMNKVLE